MRCITGLLIATMSLLSLLAAMQKTADLRLVLMSATGDHNLVRERIPYCQQLVMKGDYAQSEARCFLE